MRLAPLALPEADDALVLLVLDVVPAAAVAVGFVLGAAGLLGGGGSVPSGSVAHGCNPVTFGRWRPA